MMNSAFNDQILAEKLKKLNNSQQSIETLSHWCIFHRKKAHLVVETWDKQLRVLPKEQRVPFLYLANDILQNSRRKGGEFVAEFWKVLPGALKDVIENGDEQAHNVVQRLVNIWDERKVFGIRTKSLREELLGSDPPKDLTEQYAKSSHISRVKSPVGGFQEKLTSVYRSVDMVASEEDAALGRCTAAVIRIEGLEKEADDLKDKRVLMEELQKQENIVSQCIEQLEASQSARISLVSLLKEALREQESKLELVRSQLQTAKLQAQHSSTLRQKIRAHSSPNSADIGQINPAESNLDHEKPFTSLPSGSTYNWQPLPATEEMNMVPDGFVKATTGVDTSAAAEVAAKLAASSSSAQVLASVLSSMVAEQGANVRTASAPLEANTPPEKRQRVDPETDPTRSNESAAAYGQQPPLPPLPLQSTNTQAYSTSVQLFSSPPQPARSHYPPLPPGPPKPQYMADNANVSSQAFGYAGALSRPPPPPPLVQGQLTMNNVQMVGSPQVFNPGTYQAMQPAGGGYYEQRSLPASQFPRH